MAKQWKVKCKYPYCKNDVEYSDMAFTKGLDRGKSRPEYCSVHQPLHARYKRTMALTYFNVVPTNTDAFNRAEAGALGKVHHDPREHISKDIKGKFDPNKFGVTTKEIKAIFEWLADPEHQVAIVVGPTGSGKSTALPYWLLFPPAGLPQDQFTKHGQILITQPRIIATTSITEYLGTDLIGSGVGRGHDVGFRHSGNVKTDWNNALAMCTDGTLINMIEKGDLDKFSIVMIDEAHERSNNIDLILRLLKEKLPLYPRLKVIIASATIDADSFLDYFSNKTAKIVNFEGRRKYKYKTIWRDPSDELPYDKSDLTPLSNIISSAAATQVYELLEQMVDGKKGDILVFLPGIQTIESAVRKLQSMVNQNGKLAEIVDVLALYRDKPQDEKEKILKRELPRDHIMVVISTNIAEASITIDSIVYVVDSGLENQSIWDENTHTTKIPTIVTSKANARQRWGRAGRTRDGEVYTLYTESQFSKIFDNWPVPELQRSSMEGVVLAAKATGIIDLTEGWIQNPNPKSIIDATSTLQKSGALTANGMLTDYGLQLRHLSYPSPIADLIMISDQFGCAVEIATLVPVIKNGGLRSLLTWKWSWDAHTKRHVLSIQKGLAVGCTDDIDFVLKLYASWSQMPWLKSIGIEKWAKLQQIDIEKLSKNQLLKLRKKWEELQQEEWVKLKKEWAKYNFVREEILEEIAKERGEILERFFGHKKDKAFRPINFSLLPRIKLLLGYCLPGNGTINFQDSNLNTAYLFQQKLLPNPTSFASFAMMLPTSWRENPARTDDPINVFEIAQLVANLTQLERDPNNKTFLSRFFLDQLRPIDSVYECTFIERASRLVKLQSLVKESGSREASFTIKVEEDALVESSGKELFLENEEERDESEEQKGYTDKKQNSSKATPIFEKIGLQLDQALLESPTGQDTIPSGSFVAKVLAYGEWEGNPVPIVERIPSVDPFDVFSQRYRMGSTIEVITRGFFQAPGDHTASLIVEEPMSKMDVLVDAEDLTFASSPYPALHIPANVKLHMTIAGLNYKQNRVRLTLLPTVEREIISRLNASSRSLRLETKATVSDIRDNGLVSFVLETSNPLTGLFLLASIFESKLRNKEEFPVGSIHKLTVLRQAKKDYSTNLGRLPKPVRKQFERDAYTNIKWRRGVLTLNGHMEYDVLRDLMELSNEATYVKAVTRLWWLSNRLSIASVYDQKWVDTTSEVFQPGSQQKALVVNVTPAGVNLLFKEESNGVSGFAPKREVLLGRVNLERFFVGRKKRWVTAEILEVKGDRELFCRIVEVENDPFDRIEEDTEIRGTVTGISDAGFFVEVAPGVDGMLYKSQIPEDVDLEQIKVGNKIKVRVYSVSNDERRISLDFVSIRFRQSKE